MQESDRSSHPGASFSAALGEVQVSLRGRRLRVGGGAFRIKARRYEQGGPVVYVLLDPPPAGAGFVFAEQAGRVLLLLAGETLTR